MSTVTTRKGAVRGLRGQDVSESSLERDRLALIDLYRSYGFPEAEIGDPTARSRRARTRRVWSFPSTRVFAGSSPTSVSKGFPAETVAALEKTSLPIEEATPWDPRQVEETRRRLEALLADTGYPDGRVDAEVDTSRLGEAHVVLTAEPGSFVRIGKIVIAGLQRTRESVVARTLRRTGVREGEPYSRAKMLLAQQQLYELALFRRVELLPLPGQERHTDRGLVVLLEEGLHKSYVVGLGWNETDRFRVTLGWSHLNLFGGAHAFSVETVLSGTEQRFQIGVREPRLPKLNLPAYFVIYRTYEEFATYAQRRQGLWIDVGDRYKRPFRSWWRYEYQIVQPENVSDEIDREEEEARISSITPTLEWDFRDNQLVPTRGTYSARSPSTTPSRSSRPTPSSSSSVPARPSTAPSPTAAAPSVSVSAPSTPRPRQRIFRTTSRSRSTPVSSPVARTPTAPSEGTIWASPARPSLEGDPIGGNALVLFNAEYIRKLWWLFSTHVFVDAGNVWASPRDVRFEDIRWGAGLGFSLDTPAGPIRLEYGWKLDREPERVSGSAVVELRNPILILSFEF